MSAIVTGSLRDYPAWQIGLALAATAHQLTRIASGEGVVNTTWHTYWAIEKFAPAAAARMHAARQQRGEIGFAAINRIHQPVALAAMLLLLATDLPGWRREPFADLTSSPARRRRRCSPMPSSAECCRIRMTVMARAWSGSRRWW